MMHLLLLPGVILSLGGYVTLVTYYGGDILEAVGVKVAWALPQYSGDSRTSLDAWDNASKASRHKNPHG